MADSPRTAAEAAPVTPWTTQEQFVTLREIRAAAEQNVTAPAWHFLEGGSGEEWTLARNCDAFSRWQFRPRSLTGIEPPDTRMTLLGIDLSMPIVTAPFGFDRELHAEGHGALVRGVERAGTAAIVPAVSSLPLEEVRQASPAASRLFQVVAFGAEEVFLGLGRRAAEAGYETLVVTVDTPVPGWRERSMEDRWNPDPSGILGNFRDDPSGLMSMVDFTRRMWTWDRLGKLCAEIGLPWLAKGVLIAEEARAALEAGATGVFVSNHGGRQLEGAPAAVDALEEIVEEVGGQALVGVDGGVRRGSDVLKALALGADVVAVGRPAAWGLAAAGEDGVLRALELIANELRTSMSLCGVGSISEIDRSLLQPVPR